MFDWIASNFPMVVTAFMVVIVTSVTISWVWPGRKRRAAALAETAVLLGLTHVRETGPSPRECFGEFPLFQMRGPDVMYNLMKGETAGGMKVTLFDHEYFQFQDKDSRQTVALFEPEGAGLPPFSLTPKLKRKLSVKAFREIRQRVTNMMSGYRTVDFPQEHQFNKCYTVKSAGNEEEVRLLFTPERIQRLTAMPGWTIEGAGSRLLLYRHDTLVAPKNMPDFIRQCEDMIRLILN